MVRAEHRALAVALGVSALVHLSMVTVFSIGIWFEVEPIDYYEFEIAREGTAPAAPGAEPFRRRLEPPSMDALLDDATHGGAGETPRSLALPEEAPESRLMAGPGGLPDVELPAVSAADLSRLRLRERSLRMRERQLEALTPGRGDSWARFGREVAGLRERLSALPWMDRREDEQPDPGVQRVGSPAEGFEVYIEWMDAPRDRELLFSPPIQALAGREPSAMREPLQVVFRVGPQGRVRDVLLGSVTGDEELAVGVARALTNYRFAPLPPGDEHDQHGTLLIAPERAEP
jgi:hypothetical protein